MNEPAAVVVHEDSLPTVAVTPMQMMQIAVSKGTSIEQLQQLMALQERWEANEARKAFHAALGAFKKDAPELVKDKHVAFETAKGMTEYNHATLGNVSFNVAAALAEHGLSHRWGVEQMEGGMVKVTCILSHVLGHSESTSMQSGLDQSGGKNNIQALGSVTTYLQRYTLLAAVGLATREQDDDGRASSVTPNAGAGDDLSAEQRQAVKTLAEKVLQWFETDSVGDAFAELDNANLDVDEKRYCWTFFSSEQRAALKEEGKAVRAKANPKLITQAQRKRLEARINEMGLDREDVKRHMKIIFDKDHFPDLTMPEYERLDSELEIIPHTSKAALQGQA